MVLTVILFLFGIFLLVKGGDVFIDASGWVSDVSGISRAVIGATLVSFATTAPEYFVSLIAVLKGSNDLSVGNAVGSISANIGAAFAILAIFAPGRVNDRLYGVKGFLMILASAALLLFCVNGNVSVLEGLALLAIFAVSMLINIKYSKDASDKKRLPATRRDVVINVLKFVFGAAAIIVGSDFVVDGGQAIAAALGVSEALIGLTVVAIGTSLPEIVTSVAAIVKKQNALSIGNIIGANILDTTLILATGAFVSKNGLAVSRATSATDLPVTLLLMAIAVVPTALGKRVYVWQGILLACIYIGYLALISVTG
jgi:cation:H+ antiporter